MNPWRVQSAVRGWESATYNFLTSCVPHVETLKIPRRYRLLTNVFGAAISLIVCYLIGLGSLPLVIVATVSFVVLGA